MPAVIKRGDTAPPLTAVLSSNGAPLDLTAASAVRLIIAADSGSLVLGPISIDDAAGGEVSYEWSPGDTDTAGEYRVEFEIVWGDGTVQTVPSAGYGALTIMEDLGGEAPV